MGDQPGEAETTPMEENKAMENTEKQESHEEDLVEKDNENDKKNEVEMADDQAKEIPQGKGMIMVDDCDSEDTADNEVSLKQKPVETNTKTENNMGIKAPRSIEKEVGITQYVGKHKGFFGILKQRYSDFQVNEVSSSGEVVHLSDMTIPPVPEEQPECPVEMPPELTPAKLAEINRMLGKPLRLVATSPPNLDEAASKDIKDDKKEEKKEEGEVRICVDNTEKEGRTAIHKVVKATYPNVDSAFKEIDGQKFIVVRKKKAGKQARRDWSSWPKSKQYTTFVLYKENMDTITAINLIANNVRLKPKIFAYAGTKDKRAKTSQMVSVCQVAPAKLTGAARVQKGIYVGNFTFHHKPMKLGALQGNHFRIVLREVKAEDEEIEAAMTSMRTQGFINYYGTQRFGTSNVPTHTIGRALLKSNWQEAINLILTPRDNDDSDINRSCKIWTETKDAYAALDVIRRGSESAIEAQLLRAMSERQRNDMVGAISKIPRNIRNLYLHAYQSYLWNSVASKRVEEYGLTVLPGDLVRKKGSAVKEEEVEICDEGSLDEEETETNEQKTTETSTESNIHKLSEEEAKDTDIIEVLLCLPGYNIEYPDNIMKEWYSKLLEEDGLSFDSLKHHVKIFSVGGVYRRLIMKPENVTSKICFYDDPTLPLIQSDVDQLKSFGVEENILTEGANKAVIMEMTLPPSSYATMALREVLKMDTSAEMQASLNSESSRQWQQGKKFTKGNGDDSEKGRKRHRDSESPSRHGGWGSHRGHGGRGFGRGGRGGHKRWNEKRQRGRNDEHRSKRGRFS